MVVECNIVNRIEIILEKLATSTYYVFFFSSHATVEYEGILGHTSPVKFYLNL